MTEIRTTKAWLDGDGYELGVATEQFATGNTRIVREGARYYLTDPAIDSCPADALMDVCTPIMQLVNAVCRMADSGFKSIASPRAFTHSDGGVTLLVPPMEMRMRLPAPVVVVTSDDGAIPARRPWSVRWSTMS